MARGLDIFEATYIPYFAINQSGWYYKLWFDRVWKRQNTRKVVNSVFTGPSDFANLVTIEMTRYCLHCENAPPHGFIPTLSFCLPSNWHMVRSQPCSIGVITIILNHPILHVGDVLTFPLYPLPDEYDIGTHHVYQSICFILCLDGAGFPQTAWILEPLR